MIIKNKIKIFFSIALALTIGLYFFFLNSASIHAETEPAQETQLSSRKPQNPFTFIAIADSENYKDPFGLDKDVFETWEQAAKKNADFVIFTGDIITASAPTLAENRVRITKTKELLDQYFPSTKYYLDFAHHDLECGDPCVDLWNEIFFGKEYQPGETRKLYYSFDYANTHFVLLSSDYPLKRSVDQAQLEWLDQDLEQTNKKYKIVVSHVPPITFFEESKAICHDMSCSEPNRTQLMNILKKHQVDLVLSGHEEAFALKFEEGINFVLCGQPTGGEPRYEEVLPTKGFAYFEIGANYITLKGVDAQGNLIRRVQLK